MNKPVVVVTLPLAYAHQELVRRELEPLAKVVYLPGLGAAARKPALASAAALLSRHTGKELEPGEAALVRKARLVQFINSGLDFVPLDAFDPSVPIASNKGAYAQPIAEHAMAMYLAASKRLLVRHQGMREGRFDQFVMNQSVAGKTCGILGLGGIGGAIAPLARAFGMRVSAINRRGTSDEAVDHVGTLDDLDTLLAEADVLMVCTPLTERTRGLLGARELALMKPDAALVNLARGEIVDETALFERLQAFPEFTACIEAWWIEPTRHGEFRLKHPFLELPNVIASPHNSASVPSSFDNALLRALQNLRAVLQGAPPQNLLGPDERGANVAMSQ